MMEEAKNTGDDTAVFTSLTECGTAWPPTNFLPTIFLEYWTGILAAHHPEG